MPEEVAAIYEEARQTFSVSPRSAAALLRLATQMLVDNLVDGNLPLDRKIGRLVQRGLDPTLQQALDVLRVIGNNAVHPGQIAIDGESGQVGKLFDLLNLVVEQFISRERVVADLFADLPEGPREAISRRDGSGQSTDSV